MQSDQQLRQQQQHSGKQSGTDQGGQRIQEREKKTYLYRNQIHLTFQSNVCANYILANERTPHGGEPQWQKTGHVGSGGGIDSDRQPLPSDRQTDGKKLNQTGAESGGARNAYFDSIRFDFDFRICVCIYA